MKLIKKSIAFIILMMFLISPVIGEARQFTAIFKNPAKDSHFNTYLQTL